MVRSELRRSIIIAAIPTHGNFVLGKYFYIELEGTGKLPLLHFGMTGMLHVRLPCMLRSGLIILFQGERPAYPSVQDEDP